MKVFLVSITTLAGIRQSYPTIARSSFDAHDAALDHFGLCASISVRPL